MSRFRNILAATAAALVAGAPLLALPTAAPAQINIGVSVNVGFPPPPLPIYAQPVIPAYGYIWVPGYWAWDDSIADYYWIPGTWVQPPRSASCGPPPGGDFNNGRYGFNPGYWGPQVGFYGGINYGYGYGGNGYQGGRWQGNNFYYNNTVNNITNVRITNVYRQTVINNTTVNNVSFNGGKGGVAVAQPLNSSSSPASRMSLRPRPRSSTSSWPNRIRNFAPASTMAGRRLQRLRSRRCSRARAWSRTRGDGALPTPRGSDGRRDSAGPGPDRPRRATGHDARRAASGHTSSTPVH